jgi:predicted permease
MRHANKIRRLFVNLLRRRHVEDSLDAELRAYVEDLTERKIAQGVSPEEAQRQALREAGGIEQVKEQVRDAWLGQGIDAAIQDFRYTCRTLWRSPGFTAVVVATLALGIGANLTMFSLMRAVLWRPLPYPEPDRIVMIQVDARGIPNVGATVTEARGLSERSHSFQQVSIVHPVDANIEYAGEMEHVAAASVSDNFLPLLGARPALGRGLDSRLDEGKQQVLAILISDELWRRRFSADPNVIGKAARVNNLDVQIAGVLPPAFRLFLPPSVTATEQIDVWFPTTLHDTSPYRGNPVMARLRPGVTLDQANAELAQLAPGFAREQPEAHAGGQTRYTVSLLHDETTREARPALLVLSGAVALVLLIACVNVANLTLARGSARERELEIRRALGASRIRIIRQLLTESLVLAGASAAIGLFCARFGLEAIGHLGASHIPLQSRIGVDVPVALSALALSVVTTILFGLLPAWRLASGRTSSALRAGRAETAGTTARKLQRGLVVTEIALSTILLTSGCLMLRSFVNLMNAPLGFDSSHVVTARVPFTFRKYPQTPQRLALLQDVLERVRALPEVESASAASPLPLVADQETRRVGRSDQPDASPDTSAILATQQTALPGYLGVIGTPLQEGRDFTDNDNGTQRDVTIIDAGLAKRLWPEGAIGQRLAVYRTGHRQDLEVIGVTAAVRATQVRDESIPHFMIPYHIYPIEMSLVIKTRASTASMAPGIQSAVAAAHSGRAAFDIRSMSSYVADSIGDTRFILLVLAAFAAASVLLAGVGLYGTLAYLTAQRTREFGIRLALGSSVKGIMAIVMQEGLLLAAAGVAVGFVGGMAATGAIRGLLYGVQPLDTATLVSVVVLVASVALIAAGVPACRAARTDPQISLRSE